MKEKTSAAETNTQQSVFKELQQLGLRKEGSSRQQ